MALRANPRGHCLLWGAGWCSFRCRGVPVSDPFVPTSRRTVSRPTGVACLPRAADPTSRRLDVHLRCAPRGHLTVETSPPQGGCVGFDPGSPRARDGCSAPHLREVPTWGPSRTRRDRRSGSTPATPDGDPTGAVRRTPATGAQASRHLHLRRHRDRLDSATSTGPEGPSRRRDPGPPRRSLPAGRTSHLLRVCRTIPGARPFHERTGHTGPSPAGRGRTRSVHVSDRVSTPCGV